MGILSGMERRASIENPRIPLSSPEAFSLVFGDAFTSASGVDVTVEKALGLPPYWSGVNFIADTIATMPLQLFRAGPGGEATLLKADPLYRLLHDVVNEDRLTSYKWRKLMMTTALTEGRSFTYIERNKAGRPANLWHLDPGTVTVVKRDNRTFYEVRDGTRKIEYRADEILDVPFMMCADGLTHRPPVSTLRNALGLAIALEDYASRFFRNGGVPPLALHGPQASAGAVRRATDAIDDAVRRAQQENRNVLYMPDGHELKPVGFNPEQGQLVDSRRFQLEEIARILSLPPIFLQDLTHGTYSNSEQQDLHVVKHTISHWVELLEQEMNAKLTGPGERSRYVEFNLDGLLRGDFKTRMDGFAQAVQNAILTPNEGRAMLNRPAKDGGDQLLIQGATVPLTGAGQQQQPQTTEADEGGQGGEADGEN